MTNSNSRRVVITGFGTVSALGHDWESVRTSLKNCRNAVVAMPDWDLYKDMKTRLAAPVSGFVLPSDYRARERKSMGRVAQMGVVATERALTNAGLLDDPVLGGGRCGISYGSAGGSSSAGAEFFALLRDHSMGEMNTTTYTRLMSHTAPVNISIKFGITGRMYTTTSACTAGSQGIGYAYEAIKLGLQDVMVAGGAEELCPTEAAVFDVMMAASRRFNENPEDSPRPFDSDRDGLVIGEGATTLILESLERALARGADIYGEIVGYATNTDGVHLVRPQQASQEAVMRDALTSAETDSGAIGYVSAHATATDRGDIIESEATYNVLGHVPISAMKSYTGHSLGACGAFELWTAIMMMNEGWFSPTLNLHNLDPECADLDYIREDCRPLEVDYVMSNNFAFGGVNTSIIARRWMA